MIGLIIMFIAVLTLPFLNNKVEKQIEIFLFIMGIIAVTIVNQWSVHLLKESIFEPIKISLAVLIFGLIFKYTKNYIDRHVNRLKKRLGLGVFVFLLVFILGLMSSLVTAIMSSLILVEIISYLKLNRKTEIKIVVISCFSIGLGAVLTPIGEPLSTIIISKLKNEPYHADFFFLFRLLWWMVLPTLVVFGALAALIVKDDKGRNEGLKEKKHENTADVLIRALKVYIFIMGLIFLGNAFKPIIDVYITKISFAALFWINITSSVLDNATLAAAEIGPNMSIMQIISATLALAISGGMLIPGNIPNIISANKLGIKSKEWAKVGIPFGLVFMILFFVIIVSF